MNEYYSSGEYNHFEEQKVFSAEFYNKTKDVNNTGAELCRDGHEHKPEITKSRKKSNSSNPFKRLVEKMTTSATSIATSVASTVVVAAVSVAVCLNILSPTPKLEVTDLNVGNDYVEYNVAVDELSEDVDYSLVVENNYHTFEYPVEDEGEYNGLVTGLKPGLVYTLSLVGQTENEKSTYHENKFYTTNIDTVSAVFDVTIEKSALKGVADIAYSVYVSDSYKRGSEYFLEIINQGQSYYVDNILTNGYFTGIAHGVPRGQNIISVKGTVDGQITVIGEYILVNEITPEPLPKPPIVEPPIVEPPIVEPPIVEPPIVEPPIVEPPIVEPPEEIPYVELSELVPTGINSYDINYIFHEKSPDSFATMYFYYYGPQGETTDERQLYYESVGNWSSEYVELPNGCTSLKIMVTVSEIGETGDPVDVFTTEKTFEFTNGLVVSPWVDIESGMTYLDVYGNLPADSKIAITDKLSGETLEFPIYDESYRCFIRRVEWKSKKDVVEYSYCVTDVSGEIIDNGGDFNVDYTVGKSEYTFNYRNPGDALVTYNGDGTMNVYIYVEFSSDDPDLFCELTLDKVYRLKSYIFVIEDVAFDAYGLTYRICKEIDGVIYVMYSVTPSGAVGEQPYIDYGTFFNGINATLTLSQNTQCDFDNIRFVSSNGEEVTVSRDSVALDSESGYYIIEASFENMAETASAYIYVKPGTGSLDYDNIVSSIEIKGSEYRLCIIEIE